MEFIHKAVDLILHVGDFDKWKGMVDYISLVPLYVFLFSIVFAETGLVITPFLPGDSLLFAIGAISAGGIIPVWEVSIILVIAAIVGDAVNYWIGYKFGPAVFNREDSKLLNKKHLLRAQEFYEKYGGKTIILARMVPVVRTFAPFVAGVGKMNFLRFWIFNIVGAILWVGICVAAGYYFGGFEIVKKRFELVIIAIVFISILPMAWEFWRARREMKTKGFDPIEATTIGESVPPNEVAK